jgi:type I restriction enzyme S subunit
MPSNSTKPLSSLKGGVPEGGGGLLKHFKDLTLHPKNANELKGLIFQLAIKGKLSKNSDSWKFGVLSDLGPWAIGSGFPKVEQGHENGEIPFIKVSDMNLPGNTKYINFSNNFISKETALRIRAKIHPIGTVVFPKIGGAIATNKRRVLNKPTAIDNNCLGLIPNDKTSTDWIFLVLSSIDMMIYQSGTSVPSLSQKTLEQIPTSLPPLEEQKAIVATVNQLFAEVEQLEDLTKQRIQTKEDFVTSALRQLSTQDTTNAWEFLQAHFKSFFTEKSSVKKLRESILQLAVQGKLTKHWRTENPKAEVVDTKGLEISMKQFQIEAAKKKGQKTFKYKESVKIDVGGKSKGVDSLHEIPNSWIWSSLGQLSWSINDGPHFSPKYVDEGVPMISGRNVTYENGINFSSAKFVSHEDHIEFTKRGKPEVGDVLLTKGGTTGVPCVVETTREFSVWVHVALIKVITGFVNSYYLKMALASPFVYRQSQEQTHGIGNKDLGLTRMIFFAIPLPPLEEQKAIVEKVNALMALCDTLEKEIETHQTTQERWMQSCLKEVFEG